MQGTGWAIAGQAYLEAGYLNGVPLELLEFVEWGCVIGNACLAAHGQRGRVGRCPAVLRSPSQAAAWDKRLGKVARAPLSLFAFRHSEP